MTIVLPRNTIQSAANFPWLNRFQSTDRYFQLEPPSTLFFEGESRRRCSWRGNEGFGEENTESAHHSQRSTAGEIKCIGYFAWWPRIGRLDVPPIPRNRNFRPSSFKSKHSIFLSNGSFFLIIPHLNFIIEISYKELNFFRILVDIHLEFYFKIPENIFSFDKILYKSYFIKLFL